MLNYYSVKMSDGEDECWTFVEARSEQAARGLTTLSWRKPWRAVEAKLSPTFYQELTANSLEEDAELLALRVANLKRGISKAIITPHGEFPSVKDAVAALKIAPKTLRAKIGVEEGWDFKKG